MFSESKRTGFGLVIRDLDGRVHAASRGYFDRIENPEIAEAMELHQAIILAGDSNMESIMVASDCLSLINKTKDSNFDRTPTGAIVYDIKKWAIKFVSCSFIHVNRAFNEVAHTLAKSVEYEVTSCWCNEVPDVIRTIMCNEQAHE
ncbi:hypothetical protein ZWY2020_012409 [Hordeum vulgare]|nr:hypothetical protein ZWY2020_012409 [Hordeum vulgare]